MEAAESYRVINTSGSLIIVVDHPFNAQFYYAQAAAGKPNPKYPGLKDYFNHTKQKKLSLWGKVELTWYPKTISDYIQPFVDSGFILNKIIESPEISNGGTIPRILTLKFQK